MPTFKELKRFCENDGWELYRTTDHYFYRKVLPNGDVLRTKVSMGTGEINGHKWKRILKQQLQVTQEEFNSKI